jgi:two-component system chemotaxis response regulator CheB
MVPRALKCIVIGASAGGIGALRVLLPRLTPQLGTAIVVVSHTGSTDMRNFCDVLSEHSRLPVEEACERTRPLPGHVYVAPSGYHLLIEHDGRFAFSVDSKIGFSRPSIDVLFESAAEAYGPMLAAIVLTGANSDGAAGLARVRELGGLAIVQDPAEAEIDTMPLAALDLAGADHCVDLRSMASLINELCAPHDDRWADAHDLGVSRHQSSA